MTKHMGHLTPRTQFTSLVLALAVIAPGATSAQEDRSGAPVGTPRSMPTGAAGEPVRSEDGAPLNHGPQQLRSTATSVPARTQATAISVPARANSITRRS